MSRHHVLLVLDVDDELLAEHIAVSQQKGGPYSPDGEEWDASDVFAMADHGIVDPQECECTYGGRVK